MNYFKNIKLIKNFEKIIIILLDKNGRHYGQNSYVYYYFALLIYKVYTFIKSKNSKIFYSFKDSKLKKSINELKLNGNTKFDSINSNLTEELVNHFNSIDKSTLRPKPANKPLRYTVPIEKLCIPQIFQLGLRNDIINSIEGYFGCLPTLQYVNMWLTLSGEESLPEMYFHCDNHAFKFVKVFVFLSDVDLDGGHHEFVKNTHTVKSFKSILSNKKVNPNYKQFIAALEKKKNNNENIPTNIVSSLFNESLIKIYGKKGMVFAEDTSGLHRGTKIKNSQSRLLLQYTFTPYDNKRKNDRVKPFLSKSLLRSAINENSSRSINEYEYITRLLLLD